MCSSSCSTPPARVYTCVPLSCHIFPCSTLPLHLRKTGIVPGDLIGVTVPTSLCTCWPWRLGGLEMYLLLDCTLPDQWLIACQLFHWTALPLACLSSCCKSREDGTTWKYPCGMDRDNVSKSAGDGPDSTNLQGGSSKNLHNLSASETRSPYWAGCLPLSNEIKVLIPNCLSSWAQTQQ